MCLRCGRDPSSFGGRVADFGSGDVAHELVLVGRIRVGTGGGIPRAFNTASAPTTGDRLVVR